MLAWECAREGYPVLLAKQLPFVPDALPVQSVQSTSDITQLIHSQPIRDLNNAITEYLNLTHRDVWLLFDNLDKGWPIKTAREEDILLLRALLEATRKLQRQFSTRNIELYATVFIRKLDVNVDSVRLNDGEKVALSCT
jgi:hypothetical protein